jgi:hypothetical protein
MHGRGSKTRKSSQNDFLREENKHQSQVQAIIALLLSRCGEWVPLPEVMKAGGAQYSARIHFARHSLRVEIQNRSQHIDGVRHSWFRIVEPHHPPAPSSRKPAPSFPLQWALFPRAREER